MKHIRTLAWGLLPLALIVLISWVGTQFPIAFFILFGAGVAYFLGILIEHLWETRHW